MPLLVIFNVILSSLNTKSPFILDLGNFNLPFVNTFLRFFYLFYMNYSISLESGE